MSDQRLDHALDLMRRLPPKRIEKNLRDLVDLVPSLCEDLLSAVDQPLKIARDKVTGKDYLLCDYNRDGDSYRSPWSNSYEPEIEDGTVPSEKLRLLEVDANTAFAQYRDMYYEGGISSVYLWDPDPGFQGFAGVILIKKSGNGSNKLKGCWDSIHVFEVQEKSDGRNAHYKLTSTVILWLQTTKEASGTKNLSGSLTRQAAKDAPVSESNPHIANIGTMVEDMENKIRNTLNEIYFGKTNNMVNSLRCVRTPSETKKPLLKSDLAAALQKRQPKSDTKEVTISHKPVAVISSEAKQEAKHEETKQDFGQKEQSPEKDEEYLSLLTELESLQLEKTVFHQECKKEKKRLNKEIKLLVANCEEPEDEEKLEELTKEYNQEADKLQKVKLILAEKSREVAKLQRTIDDIPSRAELNQYQKRLIELYDQMASKHFETKKFYILYNQLEDTRAHLDKELSLLDSILTNFNRTTANPHTKDQFLTQFEQIVDNIRLAQAKIENMKSAEKTRKEQLNEAHVDLVEKQRSYYRAVRELKEEMKRNEQLSVQ